MLIRQLLVSLRVVSVLLGVVSVSLSDNELKLLLISLSLATVSYIYLCMLNSRDIPSFLSPT